MKKPATAVVLMVAALLGGAAWAKLPAPSDEAKAKAAEAGAKTAWAGKVDAFLLCKAQDRVSGQYLKVAKGAKAPAPASACADPGPFVYPPPPAGVTAAAAPAPKPGASAPKKS